MKTRVYLNDWSINAGIVGFLNIIQHSNKEYIVTKGQNFIELDTEDLKDFHICYFKYFFDKYNIAKKLDERMKKDFDDLKGYLKIENQDANIKQKYKTKKDYLKQALKTNLDKVKKIDKDLYEAMNASYKEIDTIKTIEESEKFDEIYNILSEGFKRDDINKRITMNSFKSFLSNNYFGQPSFLNVVRTALSYEEQAECMYKDYISNIVEAGFLQDILNDKYSVEEIKEYIEKIDNNKISDKTKSIYKKLLSYIDKGKDITKIKEYLNNGLFRTCHICEQSHFLSSVYTEGNFVPLAMSSENARNFFWNMNVDFPICDMCKLILFCVPAGISSIIKIEKDVNEYKERSILCFVNYDTSVENLKVINGGLAQNSKKEKSAYNPYGDLILDIVKQEQNIANWQLQNIFVVELDVEYGAYSRIQYFNIQRPVATFLTNYNNVLTNLKDYKYRLQIMDYILKNKDFAPIITNRLYDELKKDISKRFGLNSFFATKARLLLNILKNKEDSIMQSELITKNSKKINVLYNVGIDIHEELKRKGQENKIDGYVYQLLNSIKVGNKKTFMDTVIRIHMSVGKDVSQIFLECMKNEILDFPTIGHSFLSGLISNRFDKKETSDENDSNI